MNGPSDANRDSSQAERSSESLSRWRLALGKYARRQLPNGCLSAREQRMAAALDCLYGREFSGRGVRGDGDRQSREIGPGSLDDSRLNVPQWLGEVRDLFPQDACKKIMQDALDRYGLTDVLKDQKTLDRLEPSSELLASVLLMKGSMDKSVLNQVRKLVRRVVEDIQRRLKHSIQQKIVGKRNRFQNSHLKSSQNFDAHKTIRRNLKHYDLHRQQLVVRQPFFCSRVQKHLPWEIFLCVDQSGSMAGSLIHTAVLAGAIAELPSMKVRLIAFDTSVVDLTEHVTDPVEILMSVQLGGGTNIGKAMQYCRQLVQNPRRTILVLVTDFCEGADPQVLRQTVRGLKSDGVKLIGLASLDESSTFWFDEQMAQRLMADGMEIAAVTPNRLAEWLAEVMHGMPE